MLRKATVYMYVGQSQHYVENLNSQPTLSLNTHTDYLPKCTYTHLQYTVYTVPSLPYMFVRMCYEN